MSAIHFFIFEENNYGIYTVFDYFISPPLFS